MSHPPDSTRPKRDVHHPVLFEISTEVANRVGGIYSVLKSKAPVTTAEYGSRYTLIGPLRDDSAVLEVEQMEPSDTHIRASMQAMKEHGIRMLYGRWLIEGAPRVLLIDIRWGYTYLDQWKGNLWDLARIPTPDSDTETNEAVIFGYLVIWFLGEYINYQKERAVIAQFHEWLSGVGLVLARKKQMDLITLFTTHATLLGRFLCAGSVDFYNSLQHLDADMEAGQRGIYHRYCIERGAAHSADVFTTVSDITAYESEHLLKRRPDGVTPNGLNLNKFLAVHEFQNLHAQCKDKIHDFVRGHFYGHNDFDLDDTLYFFTAGRTEYRNKGVDLFIESLARLNYRLKISAPKTTVVVFIIMPAFTSSITIEALKGQAVLKSLRDTIDAMQQGIGQRLLDRCLGWQEGDPMPDESDIFTTEDRVLLRRRVFALKRSNLPSIVTHNVINDNDDPIIKQLRRVQLFNHPSDRVKVIYHPEFLNESSPVFPIDYEEFVRGSHIGIFPSYYEPWGYTPAECTVLGVPSITTNLSGFGCYMEDFLEDSPYHGIYIVDRRNKGVEDSVNQLATFMFDFARQSRRERVDQRNRTERLGDVLDWRRMGMEYVKARRLALFKAYPWEFGPDYDPEDVSDITRRRSRRPSSAPSSFGITGVVTPGDFATLQEGVDMLGVDDAFACPHSPGDGGNSPVD